MFLSLEEIAPRVWSGVGETAHIDDFNTITGVGKYRGCFVRVRRLSGDNVNLPFDTIRLSNNTGWLPTETVGNDTYNNRPFGIIGSYPQRINEPDGGGVHGRLTVHLLSGRQPVYVAFRYIDGSFNFTRPTPSLIGRRLFIYGKQVNIGGINYVVPVASLAGVTGVEPFYVEDVILPPRPMRDMLPPQREYGWVLLALDHNFISEPF